MLTFADGVGRFILHRFCGDEEFIIRTANILAIREPDGISLWFEAETEGECVKSLEDTATLRAWPKAEVCVNLKTFDPDKIVGQSFEVPAWNAETDDRLGMIYYVEHEVLRDNTVQILGREGNVFWARWSGYTTDVNYYDGSKPDTRIEIEAKFTFKKMDKYLIP